jgi:tryptophan halogenase
LKKIIVAGGGTAGWLTALYAQRVFPSADITLIESEEYGILGAGEGSTPHLVEVLEFLGISIPAIIKNCQATIKTSIKFTNWSSNRPFYHHPFYVKDSVTNDYSWSLKNLYEEEVTNYAHIVAPTFNDDLKDYSFLEKAGESNKVPFIKNDETKMFESYSSFSLHFDARLLAAYLKSVALSRGVKHSEGIISEIIADEEGYITALQTDKALLPCDFVFDCTGFRRLIIGNHYKSTWKSHADKLPCKKAVPFFIEADKEIPPYTEAIAMKYGWIWKIPLQHRYGCGYVFDSDYISEKEAVEEIENYLGYEPKYPRADKGAFEFSAGCYEKIWIKNSIAIGLSSGFIEPLEATSIMQAIIVLRKFMSNVANLDIRNDLVKDKLNKVFLAQTIETVDFLYLHYASARKDTEFWKEFADKNKPSEKAQYLLAVSKEKVLTRNFDFYESALFESVAANWILIGNGWIDKSTLLRIGAPYLTESKRQEYLNLLARDNSLIAKFINHRELLTALANNT